MSNNNIPVKYLPLILGFVAILGMMVGFRIHNQNHSNSQLTYVTATDKPIIGQVEELLRLIEVKYVDDVDIQHLEDVATRAIINELDPHSNYLSPEDLEKMNSIMKGDYKGMGIQTIISQDTLVVSHVFENSPAFNAGINYGDQILSLNHIPIAEHPDSTDYLRKLVISDTTESILVGLRSIKGEDKELQIDLGHIHYPNVSGYSLDSLTHVIKIERFTDRISDEVIKYLEEFQKNKIIENLIIDLRDNPGGYLPEATKILNQFFIEDKRLMLYTEGEHSAKNEFKSTGRPFYQVNNIVILINENSASASEIIAGALQDWDKAVIIGQNSFGKGLVQEQFKLSNGGAVRLTTARYYTPSGRFIQLPFNADTISKLDSSIYLTKVLNRELKSRGGIAPDILVSNANDYDTQVIAHESSSYAYQIIRANVAKNFRNLSDYDYFIRKNIPLIQNDLEVKYGVENLEENIIYDYVRQSINLQLNLNDATSKVLTDPALQAAVKVFEDTTINETLEKIRIIE